MTMEQKIVLVTGASSGIGAATARLYAAQGVQVVLVARNSQNLEAKAQEIRGAGGVAHTYATDLSDPQAVQELGTKVTREVGAPDILVNNAGSGRWAPLLETPMEEVRDMIAVPYLAAAYTTRAFLPAMIERGSGGIACITSPASYVAWRDACAYTAARHALKGFVEALRADLEGSGIHVTLVVFGSVDGSYWDNNPGSRISVPLTIPGLLPEIGTSKAAAAIVEGLANKRSLVVKPSVLRVAFVAQGLAPGLVARGIRLVSKWDARRRDQAK